MRNHYWLWIAVIVLSLSLLVTIGKVRRLETRIDTLQTTVEALETKVDGHQNWIEWSFKGIHGDKVEKHPMWHHLFK